MSDIISIISSRLKLPLHSVGATVALLDEGATIPFISRYRKERTGSLDEVAIRDIDTMCRQLRELEKRKEYVIETISAAGAMTDDLREKIVNVSDASTLEDLFLPYRPKRRTRATIARERGLEPLARVIMAQNTHDIIRFAEKSVKGDVVSSDEAISGALDIIAEWISESPRARSAVRNRFRRSAVISSRFIKGKEQDAIKYRNYSDFSKPLKYCPSHQYLAIRRGEKEGLLKVSLEIDDGAALDHLYGMFIKRNAPEQSSGLIMKAIADGYRRLMRPSIENEVGAEWKTKSDEEAIRLFSDNLRQLLLSPPLGHKRVIGIDPGYRTGCKVVCLDAQGNLLHNDVIYPCPPKSDIAGSARKISYLVEAYKIDAIAVGNGTASRETEQFLQGIRYPRKVQVYVVNESGASIYSASPIAREEFPDKDVTVRGAVSIGRRLIDPLAELVKIDPKSIGVGQYQHDVDQAALKDSLDYTVMSCVNQVGVNVNTASRQLLSYISGIGPQLAGNIVAYRAENGDFTTRAELKNVPRMGEKAFQQSAGFLRIPTGGNPLDNTAVHPESYAIVRQMADDLGLTIDKLLNNKDELDRIELSGYVTEKAGLPTLKDIVSELEKPGRDPRTSVQVLEFDPDIKTIDDLRPDMILNGIVNNITAFGVFVDIGVKESGLVHVSQLSDRFVSSPGDVVKLHQHVKVKVLDVDIDHKRISLSMKEVRQ